jgi:hypothetical protein
MIDAHFALRTSDRVSFMDGEKDRTKKDHQPANAAATHRIGHLADAMARP